MAEPSNAPSTPADQDPYARLKQARDRMKAIARGEQVAQPEPVKPVSPTSKPRVFRSRSAEPTQPVAAGEVTSSNAPPPTPAVAKADATVQPSALVASKDATLDFQRLLLGQQRMGRDLKPPSSKEPAAPAAAVAMTQQALASISKEAELLKLFKMLDEVGRYYLMSADDVREEKSFLSSLPAESLKGFMLAYEISLTHVKTMTDPMALNEAVFNRDRELRTFFSKHGATESESSQALDDRMAVEEKITQDAFKSMRPSRR